MSLGKARNHPAGCCALEGSCLPDPLVVRFDRCTYLKPGGLVASARKSSRDWARLWERHLSGEQRLGAFLGLPGGRCRVACIDLDAHRPYDPKRTPDAIELVDALARDGVTAYWELSRSGKGAHVWIFLDEPGAPVRDVSKYLRDLTEKVARDGPFEIFPSEVERGIFLPYFGGELNLHNGDLEPVAPTHLETNPVSCIPRACGSAALQWPPRCYKRRTHPTPRAVAFQEVTEQGVAEGKVFYVGDLPQARRGYRAKIAGGVAGRILRRGGTWVDYTEWDSFNRPPLACDDPKELQKWWRWAKLRNDNGSEVR